MAPKNKIAAPARPWYADGLRFECQPDCGACCTNHDDYSYVYLDRPTERKIARHLELDLATFRKRFTALDEGHRVLATGYNGTPSKMKSGICCGLDSRD